MSARTIAAASEAHGRPTYLDAIMYLAFEDDVVPGLGEAALAAYPPLGLVAALYLSGAPR